MSGDDDPDVLVIGGGAGGLTAAREAARRGARPLLVSSGPLGGDCTHTGCVPSKTLLSEAARGSSFDDAMQIVRARIDTIAATEDEVALRRDGIEVRLGHARLRGDGCVDIDGTTVRPSRIIIATGARPAVPTVDGLTNSTYLTNETVFDLERRPTRLAVLGGGAIGVELAEAFGRLGSSVTVIEADRRLLAQEEPEASAVVQRSLESRGVRVVLGARADRVVQDHGGIRLLLDAGDTVEADQLLVATGREPVIENLGLEVAGVEVDDRGHIVTDDTMATTADDIWAVGDVTGQMPFTHAAGRMAFVAAANATAGRFQLRRSRFDRRAVPWVIFTSPEVARVGMSEVQAAEEGGRVAYLPLTEVDRAIIAGMTDGFVKLIAGPRRGLGNVGGGRVLGATIVAPTAGELIGEVALAMRTDMFTGRLAQTTHAYPTWSMALQETAAQFFFSHRGRSARPALGPD